MKKFLSIFLSLAILASCIFTGGIMVSANSSLQSITNTYDDEGITYETRLVDNQNASKRIINGTEDNYWFAGWSASVEQDTTYNNSAQNAIKFTAAKGYDNKWPSFVEIYDNNSSSFNRFTPKANTTYSISLRYYSAKTPSKQISLQLRHTNNNDLTYQRTYNEADVLVSEIATISSTTNGWVNATATFTTGSTVKGLIITLISPTSGAASNVEVWIDDVEIKECINITAHNYDGNGDKVIPISSTTKVSDLTIPERNGYKFGGVYSDSAFANKLSSSDLLVNYSDIYLKWEIMSNNEYYCGFEDYKEQVSGMSFDSSITTITSEETYVGNAALKANLIDDGITAFEVRNEKPIIIESNKEYQLTFAYKATADVTISAGLGKASNITGASYAITNYNATAANDWQIISVTIKTDKGSSDGYALSIILYTGNSNTVFIDDILIKDLTEQSMITMPSIDQKSFPTLSVFESNATASKDIWDGTVATGFVSGTGAENDPFIISSGAELAYAIKNGGGNDYYYKITNDIYLNDITKIDWKTGKVESGYTVNPWYDNIPFAGTIDGDGHIIYGLYYKDKSAESERAWGYTGAGLIPRVNRGDTVSISKLGIDNAYVYQKNCVSAFVGFAGYTWNGDTRTGVATVNIDQCYAGINVTLEGNDAGALRGGTRGSNTYISNSYSLATLSGNTTGLIGGIWGATASISNCYNGNGTLSSNSSNTDISVSNSYQNVSGVYGTTLEEDNMKGEDVFTNASKMPELGELFVANASYPTLNAFGSNISNNEEITIWDGTIATTFADGGGTADNPYIISTGAELAYAINSHGGNEYYYKISNDIYLNDITKINCYSGAVASDYKVNSWYRNIAFAGNIDGDGHTIYGLYYVDTDAYSYAAFGYYGAGLIPRVNRGCSVSISNLGIDNAYICHRNGSSAFVGFAGATSNGDTTEGDAIVTIENSYVGGNVSIIGQAAGAFRAGTKNSKTYLTNCYSLASLVGISKDNDSTYGLIGGVWAATASINNCYNGNGPISSMAYNSSISVSNSYQSISGAYGTTLEENNMKGEDVLTNSSKMSLLASSNAYIPSDIDLENYYIYLPAGTIFTEKYDISAYDSFFTAIDIDSVITDTGVMLKGAYIKFHALPDETKIQIPTEFAGSIRQGTLFELASTSSYYEEESKIIINKLNQQNENAVNYIFITDIHFTGGTSPQDKALLNQMNLVAKLANENDSIDFVVIGGDITNGTSSKEDTLSLTNTILTPLLDCKKPVLVLVGNHDDNAYGSATSLSIQKMISDKTWNDNVIDIFVNRELENGENIIVSQDADDENSKYYFYDLASKKTRIVCLDSIDYDHTYDETTGEITSLTLAEGKSADATDSPYKYHTGCSYWGYSATQLDWLANDVLADLPDDYDVIFTSHMTIDTPFYGTELRDIMSAYQNKTAYNNESLGISVDYSKTEGRILSYQFGHTHYDKSIYDEDLNTWIINTSTARADQAETDNRILGTETEACFDVMSITQSSTYKLCIGNDATENYISKFSVDCDVNMDGIFDVRDLIRTKKVLVQASNLTTAADIDKNSRIDSIDLAELRKKLLES